jgi:tetratricopeptide (TPR) repeat protein
MPRFLLLPFAALALAAAAPSTAPDDLIRRANAAFLAGDPDEADSLYSEAEDRTRDPGLVAFNRAAILFQRGEFHAAEVNYARTLDDRACPADRAARAWFNRGTCLLRRGGSAAVYRSAIACFGRCLDSSAADAPLKANARQNLELAKLLWIEANKKAAKPETPNELPQEAERSTPPPPSVYNGSEEGKDGSTKSGTQPMPMPVPITGPAPKVGPEGSNTLTPAAAPALQPIADDSTPQKLSPEDTREYLRRAELRLRDERRSLLRTLYGTARPGIRDW